MRSTLALTKHQHAAYHPVTRCVASKPHPSMAKRQKQPEGLFPDCAMEDTAVYIWNIPETTSWCDWGICCDVSPCHKAGVWALHLHCDHGSCLCWRRASLNGSYNTPKHPPQLRVLREAHCTPAPEALRLHAVHVSNAHSRHALISAAAPVWYGDGPLAVVYRGVPAAPSLPYVHMPDVEGLIHGLGWAA